MIVGPSLAALSALALSAIPHDVAVQGLLTTTGGQPATDGTYTLQVGVYADAQGGAPVWKEVLVAVPVSDGRFAVRLGAAGDPTLPASVFAQPRWVGVAVEGEPELPRTALSAVPYAYSAELALSASVAADLACSACVGSGELAPGAITTEAIALGAVTGDRLAPAVWDGLANTYFPRTGGTLNGPLTVAGALTLGQSQDFASRPISGFRFENAGAEPVTCDLAHAGYAYFDPAQVAVFVCTGKAWRRLALTLPGETAAAAASSCLAILEADAADGDREYWIDVDGPGGVAPVKRYCDMTGGGWTQMLLNDFSVSGAGWTMTTTTTCGTLGTILGGYNVTAGTSFSTTVALGTVAHTQVKVTLDYVAIDSSDGETGYVKLDGSQLWTQALRNCPDGVTTQYCGNAPPCHGDTLYKVSITTPHTAGSLTVLAGSTLDQAPNDESFGIDNVVVWMR